MPEVIAPPTPPPSPSPAPPPTPEPSPAPQAGAPDTPKDTSDMISRMDAMLSSKPKAQEPPKAPAKGQDKAPPVGDKTKTPQPPPQTQPKLEDDEDKVGDKELRKRYKETKAEVAKLRAERQAETQSLQAKIAALENKRYWTEEDEKRHAKLEAELKQAQADLYGQNYRNSPDFKKEYVEKWQGVYQQAVARIRGMTIKHTAEDGTESERQANQTDFEKVRKAPIEEQYPVARNLFGDAAYLVLNEINQLRQIEQSGEEAAENARKSYDERRMAYENSMKSNFTSFSKMQETIDRQLVEKYPQYFGPDDSDPDANKALQEGEQFVNSILQSGDSMKPEDRGANAAILRRWASSFPRMVHTINSLKARLDERDKELAAYKKTDPSHTAPSDGGVTKPESVENTKSLSAVFASR